LKTIILGLGNPLFGDDAVGLMVARAVKARITRTDIEAVEASVAGLDVIDIIADYEKAIIIDAVQTTRNKPGTIHRLDLNQLSETNAGCAHSIDFLRSIILGRKLGLALPNSISVIGIEVENAGDLKEECTPLVKAAIPVCIEMIMAELD
jgi:hydrogenase maturation protease